MEIQDCVGLLHRFVVRNICLHNFLKISSVMLDILVLFTKSIEGTKILIFDILVLEGRKSETTTKKCTYVYS